MVQVRARMASPAKLRRSAWRHGQGRLWAECAGRLRAASAKSPKGNTASMGSFRTFSVPQDVPNLNRFWHR